MRKLLACVIKKGKRKSHKRSSCEDSASDDSNSEYLYQDEGSYDLSELDDTSYSDNKNSPNNCDHSIPQPNKVIDVLDNAKGLSKGPSKTAMGGENGTVIGRGTVTCVVAIPQFSSRSLSQRCVYRVLLDSGSDGDLAFIRKGMKESVPHKNHIAPQR